MFTPSFFASVLLAFFPLACAKSAHAAEADEAEPVKILILGGGVSGVIAARTLHERGINDFKILEARNELGGRVKSLTFGSTDNQHTVELGIHV